ncbi:MAG: hypothetical protein WA085_12965 [Sphingobium sp.]|uniref:hypothetical protein n=1 Tax=Sphingobium sp. CECT 9361 TaxID=2845384 RepID=UPI001E439ECB|nr:hypothetical protein [Sphingobium sp. CECT 9361]
MAARGDFSRDEILASAHVGMARDGQERPTPLDQSRDREAVVHRRAAMSGIGIPALPNISPAILWSRFSVRSAMLAAYGKPRTRITCAHTAEAFDAGTSAAFSD